METPHPNAAGHRHTTVPGAEGVGVPVHEDEGVGVAVPDDVTVEMAVPEAVGLRVAVPAAVGVGAAEGVAVPERQQSKAQCHPWHHAAQEVMARSSVGRGFEVALCRVPPHALQLAAGRGAAHTHHSAAFPRMNTADPLQQRYGPGEGLCEFLPRMYSTLADGQAIPLASGARITT